jgi:endonuclease/exonuclease/phosphatase family metal-dependent hydrolase
MSKLKIVTYNLRCVYNRDGINSFIHRAVFARDKIKSENPDIVAFQEVTPKNLEVMKLLLPEYCFVGMFRTSNFDGEGLYTAIRNDSLEVLGFESVWLSPTPHIPGSRFENQSICPRICLQTELLHKESRKRIRLFNVHLDHISETARIQGIQAVFDFADSFEKDIPKVILGDFNAVPSSKTIEICNGREELTDVTANLAVTFHNYGQCGDKIDYIYMEKCLADRILAVNTWEDCSSGIYLSDHYPVCADIDF